MIKVKDYHSSPWKLLPFFWLFSLFFWVEIRFSLLRQFAWLFWSISNPIILLFLLLLLLLLSDGVFLTWLRGNKRELERDTPAIIVRGGSRGGEQVLSCVIHLPLVSLLYNTADAYKCTWERERGAHLTDRVAIQPLPSAINRKTLSRWLFKHLVKMLLCVVYCIDFVVCVSMWLPTPPTLLLLWSIRALLVGRPAPSASFPAHPSLDSTRISGLCRAVNSCFKTILVRVLCVGIDALV